MLLFCIGVRLVGGSVPNKGRVEIFLYFFWGTVCGGTFDDTDADIVCRELGYPGAVGYSYGEGTGPICYFDIACTGTMASLYDCLDFVYSENDKDVEVTCATQSTYSEISYNYIATTQWWWWIQEVWAQSY